MALEKATIEPQGQASITVLFNPKQYSVVKGNQLAEIGVPGLASPILQFVHGNVRTLSMELFFDTFEQGTDVRQSTNQIYGLLAIDPDTHAPPICNIAWGSLQFRGVVERVDGTFILFLPDGTPVRARLNVTFKEHIEVQILVQQNPTRSADHRKVRIVREGDTLPLVAFEEYGDAAKWRPIATQNRIEDPLRLQPGAVLLIPAVT